MARPRTVKRLIQDLLDEYEGITVTLAEELNMAPNRLRRIILHHQIIACDEERRLRTLHRVAFPDYHEQADSEEETCPSTPTDQAPRQEHSDNSPQTTTTDSSEPPASSSA